MEILAFVAAMMLPIVYFIYVKYREYTRRPSLEAGQKQCQYCKEIILQDATVCKHCGKKVVKGFFDGCGSAIIILACALVALKILGLI